MKQIPIAGILFIFLSAGCGGGQPSVEEAPQTTTEETSLPDGEPVTSQNGEASTSESDQSETGESAPQASPSAPPSENKQAPSAEPPSQPPAKKGDEVKEAIEARITDKNIVISGKVLFGTGNAKLKKVSYEVLDEVVFALQKHPEIIKLQVVGHTDSDGDAKANQRLSKRRATAVMKYLVRNGIERDRLSAVGAGEDDPIASNDTEEGKDKNRRVEFVIVERAKVKAVTHTTSTEAPGDVDSRRATDDETEELIKKEGLDKKFR